MPPPPLRGFTTNDQFQFIQGLLTLSLPFPQFTAWITSTIIPFLVLSIASSYYYLDFLRSQASIVTGHADPQETETFDFIVVGGGSAGSIVANRLSAKYSVLLLEAGGDPNPFSYFPTTSLVTLNLPLIDWGYATEPQKNACFALENNVCRWPRGKGLGGSSLQNTMMYMRGNPRDYDEWAKLSGNEGWNYTNILPYFKKLEDYHGYETPDSVQYHGKGGPMHIEKLRFSPTLDHWLKAGEELGYPFVDANGFQRIGFGGMDVSMKYGRRFSTYSGYIRPILGRKNLKIYRYAEVIKVHFDSESERRAVGVTYVRHREKKFAKASKEVIISAGAINTPKLLMLSGIGAKEHLSSIGIETFLDLPAVGQNLKDHVFSVVGPFLLNVTESFILDRDTNLKTFTDYLFNGSGPIASISGVSGFALLPSSISEKEYPDIYILHVGIGIHANLGRELDQTFGFREGLMEKFLAPYIGRDAVFAAINLARTKSTGVIKLKSSNPFEYPSIDPNYLSHPDDVKTMVEGAKAAVNIYENTTTFQKLGATLASNPYPTCKKYPFRSDAYWECHVRSYTLTVYHPCGTCRMGMDPETSVVDDQLRVFNTKNLRVVDASVIPDITNTNIHAPTLGIGEKGADMILKYWEQKDSSTKSNEVEMPTGNKLHERNAEAVTPSNERPVYTLDPRK